MGYLIKKIGEIRIGSNILDIEYNDGTKKQLYDIHIQNEVLKLCFGDQEFMKAATSILLAKERFDSFKKGDKND